MRIFVTSEQCLVKTVRSIVPLENLISESEYPPKVIDYACGAGHFLNEYAAQIKPFVQQYKEIPLKDFYKEIVGIEKEDRLAKVAKVSAFMYGQDEIKIIDADALARHESVKADSFNVLVANPPFAVEGFLDTLEEERENYRLLETVSDPVNNRNIQCFFIERAAQLLAARGMAAIIVPSSVLSNSDATHVGSREILLQQFDIVALVELGSGTFGKTGTNTVVLFLRRKHKQPTEAEQYFNRVNDWFNLDNESDIYEDSHFIKRYCQHIGIEFSDYQTLLNGEPSAELLAMELFVDYKVNFDNSTDIKNLHKQKSFKDKTKAERDIELKKRFLAYLQAIEKDKLFYFVLAFTNPQKVLVIKSPADNKEQKAFLGYEWSAAKGSEGIKLSTDSNGNHLTPLYDVMNRDNPEKINFLIAQNFLNVVVEIPEVLQSYAWLVNLVDMLDFSRVSFDKTISLTDKKSIVIETKWDLVKLGEVADIISGGTPSSSVKEYWDGDICWATLVDTKQKYLTTTQKKITEAGLKNSSAKLLPINTVIFSSRATIGDVTIAKVETATNQGYKNFICNEKINHEFLYEILKHYAKDIASLASGMTFKEISKTEISNFKIPLPPKDIQEKIVAECEVIDKQVENAEQKIINAKDELNKIISTLNHYSLKKLENIALNWDSKRKPVTRSDRKEGKYPYYGASGIVDYVDDYLIDDTVLLISEDGANLKSRVTPIAFTASGKIWVNNHAHILKFENPCIHKITEVYLNSLDLSEYITGMAQPKLSQNNMNRIKIPVPDDLEAQKTLVAEIETLENKIAEAQKIIDEAAAKKQAVLKKYL